MDNIRFVLIVVLSMILVMLWQAWLQDYGPKPEIAATSTETPSITEIKEDLPVAGSITDGQQTAEQAEPAAEPSSVPSLEVHADKVISVTTDVYKLEIDTRGGTLRNLYLLKYPVEKDNPDVVVKLFDSSEEKLFLGQNGLLAASGSRAAADHHTVFTASQENYQLSEELDILRVPLTWSDGQGLQVRKTYVFTRGSYLIEVQQQVINATGEVWRGRQYSQLLRKPYSDESGSTFIRTYAGGVVYTEEDKYQKISFDDMEDENLNITTKGGWVAMIQHYFAAATIPPADEENHFYTKKLPESRYVIGYYSPLKTVQPDSETTLAMRMFVGPKLQPVMEKIAPGLELTVDYSWLTFIGKPIFWLLNKIHSLVGNWGFAIIGVTLCIKLLFFKLSEASYKSMAKMRKIQPRLKQLQERFADDRQRFNTEMMAMYKKEKVNPLGGCFPILVQIPVFISLYWVLIETVELRQAPFILWIQDLSAMDPYFVLPVLMGITMKIQQSLNPAPIDPVQAKVMKMFPIVFTVFFMFFPAGLVLYWVVNNTLSIIQQWYITRKIEAGEKA